MWIDSRSYIAGFYLASLSSLHLSADCQRLLCNAPLTPSQTVYPERFRPHQTRLLRARDLPICHAPLDVPLAPFPGQAPPAQNPTSLFPDPVLVLAPHADDETLGCGGTLAALARTHQIHIAVATDGRRSPLTERGRVTDEVESLIRTRREEARTAVELLGVPPENLQFFQLPDGTLPARHVDLSQAIDVLCRRVMPRTVFAPFRYDQHADHLAVYRAARAVIAAQPGITLAEYFVYFRYPLGLVPDVRPLIAPQHLVEIDISLTLAAKNAALDAFRSQLELLYPWQSRPGLSPGFVDSHRAPREAFLVDATNLPDHRIIPQWSLKLWLYISLVPYLVRWKKRIVG